MATSLSKENKRIIIPKLWEIRKFLDQKLQIDVGEHVNVCGRWPTVQSVFLIDEAFMNLDSY